MGRSHIYISILLILSSSCTSCLTYGSKRGFSLYLCVSVPLCFKPFR